MATMLEHNELQYAPRVNVPSDWQAALLEHLRILDEICADHNITYSLAFGGLLGAIRHRGFVPWDNDVDIVMDEENYNRFRQLALDGLLPEGYDFADRVTEEDYTLLFGRFINKKTSCPLGTSSFNDGMHGLFVDFFILYPLPDDPKRQEEAVTAFMVWEQLLSRYKRRSKYRTDSFYEKWRELKAFEKTYGRSKALTYAEDRFRSLIPRFGESTWCLLGSGGVFNGYGRMKTEWFTHPIRIPFENIELMAPSVPTGFCEQRYGGNWREYPSDRSFPTYSAADLNIPAHVVTQDYMQLLNQKRVLKDYYQYIDLLVEESCLMHDALTPTLKAYAELQAKKISNDLKSSNALRKFSKAKSPLMTPDEAKAILEEFKDVTDLLYDKELQQWHIAPPLPEEVLTTYLWASFVRNQEYWQVQRFVAYYQEGWQPHRRLTSASAKRLINAVNATVALYNAIDFDNYNLLTTAANTLERLCPQTVHSAVAQAYLRQNDPKTCLDFIHSLSLNVQSHVYLTLLTARMNLAIGNLDDAAIILKSLSKATKNGMILLAIQDLSAAHNLDIRIDTDPKRKPKQASGGKSREKSMKLLKDEPRDLSEFGRPGDFAIIKHGGHHLEQKLYVLAQTRQQLQVFTAITEKYRACKRLSSERFKIWETMYPRKPLLRSAASINDLDEVRAVASEYITACYRIYDKDGFGLFLDQEILDACIPVFLRDRGQTFVKDFLARIPDQHREDIDVMLRRKGVNHPYFKTRKSANESTEG